jgi:hypothetical protein
MYPSSGELGPQVAFVFDTGDFVLPQGQTTFTLRADPLAPTSQPADGTVWGNVYRVTATGPAGAAALAQPGSRFRTIYLRAPEGRPVAVIEADTGRGWQRLPTDKVGNDIYSAGVPALGDYAVVKPAVPVGGPKDGGRVDPLVWILGGAVATLAAVSLSIRRRRRGADTGSS